MGRYFFNLYNDEATLDEEGRELPDDGTAIDAARREVRIQAAESVREHGHLVLGHMIIVTDEARAEIATLTFGQVVDVRPT